MNINGNILSGVEKAVRNALDEQANLEIERLTKLFRERLLREKDQTIGRLMTTIRIQAEQNAMSTDFDIRIRFKGGEDDD